MDITTLLQDIIAAQQGIADRLEAVSRRQEEQEERLAALEARHKRGRPGRVGGRRNINAPAEHIAYAAHLLHKLNVPLLRIYTSGLLSQSRAIGLSQWSDQQLQDFLAETGTGHIYDNGLTVAEAAEMVPTLERLPEVYSHAALARNPADELAG